MAEAEAEILKHPDDYACAEQNRARLCEEITKLFPQMKSESFKSGQSVRRKLHNKRRVRSFKKGFLHYERIDYGNNKPEQIY